MTNKAGNLRWRVRILKPQGTTGDSGATTEEYGLHGEVWAAVGEVEGGNEFLEGEQQKANRELEIVMRWNPELTSADAIEYEGRRLFCTEPPRHTGRGNREWTTVKVRERE